MAYNEFEGVVRTFKLENEVSARGLKQLLLEGKIERSSWTVEKMILDQENRCIEQIEALYDIRKNDEAFRHYLKFEYELQKRALREADKTDVLDETYILMREACMRVYLDCLFAFNKAYETTKEVCSHKNTDTIDITGTDESICVCMDCGEEL